MGRHKFPLGQVVVTAGVHNVMQDSHTFYDWVISILDRHHSGDWGDMDAEDCATNESALKHGSRLMSEYKIEDKRVWIITEADRSVTTVLFPEEY